MIRFEQGFLASIFLVSCVQGWLFSTTNWPVRATGKVTCNGEPVPFVDIELVDDDLWFDDKMGETTADSNGAFQVAGSGRDLFSGKPEPYIRVCYSYSGSYGKLKVVGILKILRREKVSQRSYSSDINFGTINFDSDHCKAYIQFYKALKYYKDVAKSLLPYNTLYIKARPSYTEARPIQQQIPYGFLGTTTLHSRRHNTSLLIPSDIPSMGVWLISCTMSSGMQLN